MSVLVKKLMITETGTANDMASRNFTTQVTTNTLNHLMEKTAQGLNLTTENLAGISGKIIQPDTIARRIDIPNGWGSKRYRFIMTVGYPDDHTARNVLYYYTGYTDIVGHSPALMDFDPNMRIYINNIIAVSRYQTQTPNGLVPQVSVNECSHLLHPRAMGGNLQTQFDARGQTVNTPSTLRPVDIYHHLSALERSKTANEPVLNLLTHMDLKKSSRINNLPANFLSESLTSYQHSRNSQGVYDSEENKYSRAASFVNEAAVHGDPFIGSLTGYGYEINGYITWESLCRAHPELRAHGVVNLIRQKETRIDGPNDAYVARRGEYSPWITHQGADLSVNATVARLLLQSVPSVLMTNLISRCVVRATNMIAGFAPGQIHVEITSPVPYAELPAGFIIEKIPTLERILAQIIFKDMPVNEHAPFNIIMSVDTFGDSFVQISYNGSPLQPYHSTTWCDAMDSPMVSLTSNPLHQIANDINYIGGGLIG